MRKLTVLLALAAAMPLVLPASADVSSGFVTAGGEATGATGDYTLVDRGVVWQCAAFSTPKGTATGDLPAATSILECSFYVDAGQIGNAPSSDGGPASVSPAVAFPIPDGNFYRICVQAETLYRDGSRNRTPRACDGGPSVQSPTVETGTESAPTQIDRSDVDDIIDPS